MTIDISSLVIYTKKGDSYRSVVRIYIYSFISSVPERITGYGIIKEIENASEGKHIIAPGTLYGVLKNLQKQGLIKNEKCSLPLYL